MSSLYERLGQSDAITTIASDIVDFYRSNPRIAQRYANSGGPATVSARFALEVMESVFPE